MHFFIFQYPGLSHVPSQSSGVFLLLLFFPDTTTKGVKEHLLFPLLVPLERGGAPCLLGLVQQELCRRLLLFEHVQLIVQRFPLVLQLLLLVLVELLQAVKLLVQLCGGSRERWGDEAGMRRNISSQSDYSK